jgi:hypothetical protein
MKIDYIIKRIQEKLNKLDSKDYDNIQKNIIITAYNESRLDWLRRNLIGTNSQKHGDEGSKRRMEDFTQILKLPQDIVLSKKDGYYISQKLPDDYFAFKRLEFDAKSNCCDGTLKMICYLVGESNVDIYLRDSDLQPNFEWGETFATMVDNRLKVYTNNSFTIENPKLTYYRFPIIVEKNGVYSLEKEIISTTDVGCEFKKDLVTLFIDETVSSIAGDIESVSQYQIKQNKVETNN